MKYKLTCNDVIQAMVREDITVEADTLDDAWQKAKTKFARKYKTSEKYVEITGVNTFA